MLFMAFYKKSTYIISMIVDAYMCRHCDPNNKQEVKNKEKIKAVRTREVPLENAQTLYYLNEKPMGVK